MDGWGVQDRFTVLGLGMAPWGFSDDEIGAADDAGALAGLAFWKDLAWGVRAPPPPPPPPPSQKQAKRRGGGAAYKGGPTAQGFGGPNHRPSRRK